MSQEEMQAIVGVVTRQISEAENRMRADINQAFNDTGISFDDRIETVINDERTLFFEALRQMWGAIQAVQGTVGIVAPTRPEDVEDDALGAPVATPPVIQQTETVAAPVPPQVPGMVAKAAPVPPPVEAPIPIVPAKFAGQ